MGALDLETGAFLRQKGTPENASSGNTLATLRDQGVDVDVRQTVWGSANRPSRRQLRRSQGNFPRTNAATRTSELHDRRRSRRLVVSGREA